MGNEFWLNEEDKAMVERVVGNAASAYLAWSASNNELSEFPPSGEDLGVQQSLRKIVEGSDWTYAIYWQVSRSKTGRSALIWGNGHCREPMEGEGEGDNGCKFEKSEDEDDRRWVLRKIRACFGRSDNVDHVAAKSGKVSDVEMFYLTSMYLTFPLDTPSIPSLLFNSGRSVWVSEAISSLECYESRSYLAKLACFETVVFVPTRLGMVEIGSRRSIPEDMSVIQSAKFIAGKPSLAPTIAAPTIFCREPSVESSRSGLSSISFSPKVEDNSVYSSESSPGGAQIYGNSSNGYISETPENGRDEPLNHVEVEREGREKLDQVVVEHKGKQIFWHVKEDVALMASWCLASEENKRGEKGPSLWNRVHKLFHEARAGNPDEIADRNRESMRCRWKRLDKYGNKWIVAYKKAYGRKTSEMSEKDIEKEAIAIYEKGGGKVQDLFVFNEIMSKHPRWEIKFDHEPTRVARDEEGNDESGGNAKRSRASEDGEYSTPVKPETPAPSSGCSTIPRENEEGNDESGGNSKRSTGEDGEHSIPFKPETPAPSSGCSTIPRENEEGNDESGANSKRSRTGEDGEHSIPFKPETPAPSSGCPTIPHPTGRDQSCSWASEVAAEIRALRVARDNEVERMSKLESARIELELKKEERKIMKMNHAMLNTLLGKDHLSPEEEEMKRHLMAIVLRQ